VPSPAPRPRPVTDLTNFHVLYVLSPSQPKCSAPIACIGQVALPPNIPSAATTELRRPPFTLPRKSPECCAATATRHGRSIESDGPGLQELVRDPTVSPPPNVCQQTTSVPDAFPRGTRRARAHFSVATTTARAPEKLRGGLYRRTITTTRSTVPESALADACHG